SSGPRPAGLGAYLQEAFLFRWNLLFFFGGLAGAAMLPLKDVVFPLVWAGELAYLAGLVALPKFRDAIDAKFHAARTEQNSTAGPVQAAPSVVSILSGLPTEARRRFERLHGRCVEMRAIA